MIHYIKNSPLQAYTDVCVFDSEIHKVEMEQEMDVKQNRPRSTLSTVAPNHTEPPPKVLHTLCKLSVAAIR